MYRRAGKEAVSYQEVWFIYFFFLWLKPTNLERRMILPMSVNQLVPAMQNTSVCLFPFRLLFQCLDQAEISRIWTEIGTPPKKSLIHWLSVDFSRLWSRHKEEQRRLPQNPLHLNHGGLALTEEEQETGWTLSRAVMMTHIAFCWWKWTQD